MPTLEHNEDNLKQLVEKAWAVLKNGDMKRSEVAETMKAHGLISDLRVDAVQYQLVHLHNLCVSLILIKDNLLHFSWWDQHFPGIPTNEWKIENTSRYYEMTSYATFLGSFSVLESFVKSMHFALDGDKTVKRHESLYKLRKSLFDSYLNVNFAELHSYFSLMQTLRNCIHNSGVYYDPKYPSTHVDYQSVRYEFQNNIPPNCIQPEFLIDRIDDAIEISFQMSTSPESLALTHIENNYDLLGSHETSQ